MERKRRRLDGDQEKAKQLEQGLDISPALRKQFYDEDQNCRKNQEVTGKDTETWQRHGRGNAGGRPRPGNATSTGDEENADLEVLGRHEDSRGLHVAAAVISSVADHHPCRYSRLTRWAETLGGKGSAGVA